MVPVFLLSFILCFCRVGGCNIGTPQQIVHRGMIKIGKTDENLRRQVILSGFIFGVAGLRHAKHLCDLSLCQIVVLAQIPNPLIHLKSPQKYRMLT